MSEKVFAKRLREIMRNSTLWKVLRRFRDRKDLVWTGTSLEENYYIKLGYASRQNPIYYIDESWAGVTWQPMVYPFAAERAVRTGCDTIIDIGCGRAKKVARLREEQPSWNFIGVDYKSNIAWCKYNYNFGVWIEADLERPSLLFSDRDLKKTIVICADVIEHLISPAPLLDEIRSLLNNGACEAIISTPERDLTRGTDDFGPPANPCHVREWSTAEFRALLQAWDFRVDHLGLTRSHDAAPDEKTILAVVSRRVKL